MTKIFHLSLRFFSKVSFLPTFPPHKPHFLFYPRIKIQETLHQGGHNFFNSTFLTFSSFIICIHLKSPIIVWQESWVQMTSRFNVVFLLFIDIFAPF